MKHFALQTLHRSVELLFMEVATSVASHVGTNLAAVAPSTQHQPNFPEIGPLRRLTQ